MGKNGSFDLILNDHVFSLIVHKVICIYMLIFGRLVQNILDYSYIVVTIDVWYAS